MKALIIFYSLLVYAFAAGSEHKISIAKKRGSAKFPETTFYTERPGDKEAIKKTAIAFYRWYEITWMKNGKKREAFLKPLVRDKHGKIAANLADYEADCPCSFDEKAWQNYFLWLKQAAPWFHEAYFLNQRARLIQHLKEINTLKGNDKKAEAIESFVITGMFHLAAGQDFPSLSKSGIFGKEAVWKINVKPDATASVATTFKMPASWGGKQNTYLLQMINEKGVWKLTSQIEEDVVEHDNY